jgi:hypothetical protein
MNVHMKRTGAGLVATVAVLAAIAPAAQASGSAAKIRSGACAGSTHWKLKASPDNGRIEVQGEVDSNRNGQVWRWRIVHNGSVSASGLRTTRAPSGSFEVRRLLVNARGTDALVFRAVNTRSGEVCRGTLNY